MALFISACDSGGELSEIDAESLAQVQTTKSLPVAFDRVAGYVAFDVTTNEPSFVQIQTTHPALHFAGMNLDESAIAYTNLARFKDGVPLNREQITLQDSLKVTLDQLVPTGELIVEKNGEATTISVQGEMATFATWSPVDSNILAYSYARFDTYGIAVVNIATQKRFVLTEGDFAPDYIAWSDDGKSIGIYVSDPLLATDDTDLHSNGEFNDEPPMIWQIFDLTTHTRIFKSDIQTCWNRCDFSVLDSSMEIQFPEARVFIPNVMGGEVTVFDNYSPWYSFRADQIRYRSERGMAFVNFESDRMILFATNGVDEPMKVAIAATVTYKLPFSASSTVNMTQVGYD